MVSVAIKEKIRRILASVWCLVAYNTCMQSRLQIHTNGATTLQKNGCYIIMHWLQFKKEEWLLWHGKGPC